MAKGIYNETYFLNNPEECGLPAVLYCVILVDRKTSERECLKIGIAKGKDWRHVIKRSNGFKGYEIRIQKIVHGTLEEIYYLEQMLHEQWQHLSYRPKHNFGGKTECFVISDEIIRSIPDSC